MTKALKPIGEHGRRITYDDRKVRLAGASTQGFGKYYAEPGDLITFKTFLHDGTYEITLGRVIGRIASTDSFPGSENGKGLLLVCAVGENHAFGMERWVRPDFVTYCTSPDRALEFLSRFLAASPDALARYVRTCDSRDL